MVVRLVRVYNFEISGRSADDQTWTVSGDVTDSANDVGAAFDAAMRLAFSRLTEGKAIFGKPGVGCKGPYSIDKIVLERSAETMHLHEKAS